jgi:hypothetical protein
MINRTFTHLYALAIALLHKEFNKRVACSHYEIRLFSFAKLNQITT